MRRLGFGLLLSLAMGATLIAKADPTAQIIIRCRCLTRYQQWLCETFWWALC